MSKVVVMFTRNEKFLPSVEVELEGESGSVHVEEIFKKAQQISPETIGACPAVISTSEGQMLWWDAHVF